MSEEQNKEQQQKQEQESGAGDGDGASRPGWIIGANRKISSVEMKLNGHPPQYYEVFSAQGQIYYCDTSILQPWAWVNQSESFVPINFIYEKTLVRYCIISYKEEAVPEVPEGLTSELTTIASSMDNEKEFYINCILTRAFRFILKTKTFGIWYDFNKQRIYGIGFPTPVECIKFKRFFDGALSFIERTFDRDVIKREIIWSTLHEWAVEQQQQQQKQEQEGQGDELEEVRKTGGGNVDDNLGQQEEMCSSEQIQGASGDGADGVDSAPMETESPKSSTNTATTTAIVIPPPPPAVAGTSRSTVQLPGSKPCMATTIDDITDDDNEDEEEEGTSVGSQDYYGLVGNNVVNDIIDLDHQYAQRRRQPVTVNATTTRNNNITADAAVPSTSAAAIAAAARDEESNTTTAVAITNALEMIQTVKSNLKAIASGFGLGQLDLKTKLSTYQTVAKQLVDDLTVVTSNLQRVEIEEAIMVIDIIEQNTQLNEQVEAHKRYEVRLNNRLEVLTAENKRFRLKLKNEKLKAHGTSGVEAGCGPMTHRGRMTRGSLKRSKGGAAP